MRRPRITAAIADGLATVGADAAVALEEREGWEDYSDGDKNEWRAIKYIKKLAAWHKSKERAGLVKP